MKIRPVGAELFDTDGRTDITKLIVAFRNFANAPKYVSSCQRGNSEHMLTCEGLRTAPWVSATTLQTGRNKMHKHKQRCLKDGAYTSLVRPILQYAAAYWDPYREGQISALVRVQKKAAKFAHHSNSPKWRRAESYHACVHSAKLTVENGRGRLWGTDWSDRTIWAG